MLNTWSKIILMIITGIVFLPGITFGEMSVKYTDDGIKIKKDDRWITLGGTLMWDIDSASDVFWETEDNDDGDWRTSSELRRARLSIKTKIADNWKAKLEIDFREIMLPIE